MALCHDKVTWELLPCFHSVLELLQETEKAHREMG